jgi:hypothetical protein
MVHLAFQPVLYSGPAILVEVFREIPIRAFIGSIYNLHHVVAPEPPCLPALVGFRRAKVALEFPAIRTVDCRHAPL